MKKRFFSIVLIVMLLLTVLVTPISAATVSNYQYRISKLTVTPVMYGAVMTPYQTSWQGLLNDTEKQITSWRGIQPQNISAFYITMEGTCPKADSSNELVSLRYEAIDKWNGNNSYWFAYCENPTATTRKFSFVIPNAGYPFMHDWDNTIYQYTELNGIVGEYYLSDSVRDTMSYSVNFTFYWQYQ